jgi:ribonuclease HII
MGKRDSRLRISTSRTKKINFPTFQFERSLWKKGFNLVAGCDEVGRGCFAGPVVAGCVVFPPNLKIPKKIYINDSKKITSKRREKSSLWIKKNALAWGTGESSAALINKIGISKATKRAFRLAIKNAKTRILHLGSNIDFLLIDAFYIPFVRGLRRKSQKAIIDGDEKSLTIAAASIIAKVYRDKLMEKIGSRIRYGKYYWVNNKGYGTKKHQEAIKKYGLTGYHRKQFVETFLNNSFSSQAR